MKKYRVTAGQNLYDIALHIYGSVEGITDLLVCNPQLSLATEVKAGDELAFTDGFIIDATVAAYHKKHGIVPANGERNVYFKEASGPLSIELLTGSKETYAGLLLGGEGIVELDWGDNSEIQEVRLGNIPRPVTHSFDNSVSTGRSIRLYGDFRIREIDFSRAGICSLFLLRPVAIECINFRNSSANLDFLPLCRDLHTVDLSGGSTDSLLPLAGCKDLMSVNLSGMKLQAPALDNYLIALAGDYRGRRSCTLILPGTPSGSYREPRRGGNAGYIITSGMEAIWVIVNEPAWNEGGGWKFIAGDKTYTPGPDS
jgi:hypothetical protein